MKKTSRLLFLAACSALLLAACAKEKENEALNPSGTPVQFTLSGDNAFSGTAANVKVTASTAVPADVTVALGLDPASTIKETSITFPLLVIAKGSTEASGKVELDPSSLAAGTTFDIVIKASVSGVDLAQKVKLSFTTDKAPEPSPDPEPEPSPDPEPGTLTIDGDPADWDDLDADYLVALTCPDGVELPGLKNAKIYYDDKLYLLMEVTDEALAKGVTDGKLRFHIFLNGDNNREGGLVRFWGTPDIDYMLEGKMTSGGSYCKFESNYYKWVGDSPDAWSWESAGVIPETECAGAGNFYEMALDYSTYPGGLGDNITLGFDIADGDYNVTGYLPNTADATPCLKPIVTKVGAEKAEEPAPVLQEAVTIDGDLSDWDEVPVQASSQNSRIREWKFTYDAVNVYCYFKLRGDRIGGDRILYIGFDNDNDETTGNNIGNVPGVEAYVKIQPITGTDPLTYIQGVAADSEVTIEGGDTATGVVKSWAYMGDDSEAYVEMSIPRDKLAVPADGNTIKVGASYEWYVTGTQSFTL